MTGLVGNQLQFGVESAEWKVPSGVGGEIACSCCCGIESHQYFGMVTTHMRAISHTHTHRRSDTHTRRVMN